MITGNSPLLLNGLLTSIIPTQAKQARTVCGLAISEPDDSKGALPYDTYIIEELRSDSNKGFEIIPPFEIVVSKNNLVIDLGTLTDEYEKEISIHTTATSKDGEKTILAGKRLRLLIPSIRRTYKRHKISAQRLADVKGRKRRAYH